MCEKFNTAICPGKILSFRVLLPREIPFHKQTSFLHLGQLRGFRVVVVIREPNPFGKSRLIRVGRNNPVSVYAVQLIDPEIVLAPVPGFLAAAANQVIENEIDRPLCLEPNQVLIPESIEVKRRSPVAVLARKQKGHFAALRRQPAAARPDIDNKIRLAVAIQIAGKHLHLGTCHAVREGCGHQVSALCIAEVDYPAIGCAAQRQGELRLTLPAGL